MRRFAVTLSLVTLMAGVAFAAKPPSGTADYPLAHWVPAASSNYTKSDRPNTYPINYWICHVVQGSYSSCISWFQNRSANVSAHYVARSSDGDITQMVMHKDVAWHAGNWDYNCWSLGIEHEGYVDNCAWFTDVMYQASADCVKWASENGTTILKDRQHVIGHNEVPGATHTDPGACWDWDKYMAMITGTSYNFLDVIVDNAQAGFSYAGEWTVGTSAVDKYGADYRFSSTANSGGADQATWQLALPQTGTWQVDVWYSQGTNRSTAAPYTVNYSGGSQTFAVSQQNGGGQWRTLGSFAINAGEGSVVLSDDAPAGYVVIADAVRARLPQ